MELFSPPWMAYPLVLSVLLVTFCSNCPSIRAIRKIRDIRGLPAPNPLLTADRCHPSHLTFPNLLHNFMQIRFGLDMIV